MKAAVMYPGEGLPRFTEMPVPEPANEKEILVRVKAAALKNLDKSRAGGTHYSSETPSAGGRVTGGDGVCLLPDGTRVYAIGASGMMAEQATIHRGTIVPLPEALEDATAAALGNAVIGSAMALRFRARLREGETVLVNGATGFTGRMAVQIARRYGAGKIIATGRNETALRALPGLGADQVISLEQSPEALRSELKSLQASHPIGVVIDYLWGRPAETILSTLKGRGQFSAGTRFISVGSMAGDALSLSAEILRSTPLQLCGSGLGAWSEEEVATLFAEILPDMFRLAAEGQLQAKTRTLALKEIAKVWETGAGNGERIVVTI